MPIIWGDGAVPGSRTQHFVERRGVLPGAALACALRLGVGGCAIVAESGGAMALSSGTRFGPYEIVSQLGRGGMSDVYRARDTRLGRDVALKLLGAADAINDGMAHRFEREARAAGALNHPNVLSILDVGIEDQRHYLVYELLEGRTLRERLSAGRPPLEEAVGYAVQIGRGLSAAHEKGIVHRDLKPENLFVTSDGRMKILDFGLAKRAEPMAGAAPVGRADDTKPGFILGSVGYMAPEQILGVPADARADLFSFGAILHELLSGERAFAGSSESAVLNAILTREPAKLSTLVAEVPERLERLVRACLRKEPQDRIQHAREVVHELETVAAALEAKSPLPRIPLRWIGAVTGAAIVVTGLAFAARFERNRGALPAGVIAVEPKSLAVLPFTRLEGESPADSADFFNAGLVEMITSKLSRIEQLQQSLRVVSSRDLQKEGVTTAREAGRMFGASFAISGVVRRRKDAVGATLTLVDAKTALVVASRDAWLRQDESGSLDAVLAEAIAQMLGVRLGPKTQQAIAADGSTVPSAKDEYLEGLGYLRRHDRSENPAKAIALFERALEQDPRFVLAIAGLAEAQLRQFEWTHDVELLAKARATSLRALAADETLAEVHMTLALVEKSSGAFDRAIERFERALQLQPRNPDALRELANTYDAAGRTADAKAAFHRAIALRPGSWEAHADLGSFYNQHGRLAEAAQAYQKVLDLIPDSYLGYWSMGGIFLREGRLKEAEQMLSRSVQLKPSAAAYSNLGSLLYYQRRYAEAAELYRKATGLSPDDERFWGNLADALTWSGRKDEAGPAYRAAIARVDRQLAIDRDSPSLLARRAMYLVAIGERRRALDDVKAALRSGTKNAQVHFRTGLVYEQCGMRGRALDELRLALDNGYAMQELRNAPPLASLLQDPRFVAFQGGKTR